MSYHAERPQISPPSPSLLRPVPGRLLLLKYPPLTHPIVLSPSKAIIGRCMLLWGVYPILCKRFRDTDKLVDMAEEMLEQLKFVHKGQIVGIVAGTRTKSGATNFMRLHMIGDRDSDPPTNKPKNKKK